MAPLKCWALNCTTCSDTSNPDAIRMFKFPSDLNRCQHWVQLSGNPRLLEIPSRDLCKRAHLCALHFEDKHFYDKNKNRLNKGVVIPSKFFNSPIPEDIMLRFPVERIIPEDLTLLASSSSSISSKRKSAEAELDLEPDVRTPAKIMHIDLPSLSEKIPSQLVSAEINLPSSSSESLPPQLPSAEIETPKTPEKRIDTENKKRRVRVTKASLTKSAGIKKNELTPRKQKLVNLAFEKHKHSCHVRRRLIYARRKHRIQSSIIQNSTKESNLNQMDMSIGAKFILAGEIRNFNRKPNARVWLLKEKCWALSLYKRSPRNYRYMRSQMTMPCERTLNNILADVDIRPGISPLLLSILKKKTFNFEEKDRAAVLCFDEIFTEDDLSYNEKSDQIDGYEDYGPRGRTNKKADHVLQFQVRLLSSGFTYPVANFPVGGSCPKETLAILIKDVIRALHEIGIIVVATISDQGPTNQGAITILRSKCSQGELDPVYEVDGKLVVHLWDFPHIIKNLRNHLLSSDFEYEPGKIAQWQHIIEFFKLDEGICKLSKLRYAHLCPLGRNKMRVCLASEIFSETNYAGMMTFIELSEGKRLAGCEATAELLLIVDKLFDSVNGPSRRDKPKLSRCDVTEGSYHEQYWREMGPKLKQWNFIRKETGERYVPPCVKGLIDNLIGLRRIWSTVQKLGMKTLHLRYLNQDALENYFGQIRQTCGSNTDPSYPQYVAGQKTLLVQQVTAPVRGGNCQQTDDSSFLDDLASLIQDASTVSPQEETDPVLLRAHNQDPSSYKPLNKLRRQGASLTCSNICTKVLNATKRCDACTKDLSTEEFSSDFTFQKLKEGEISLDRPSPNFTNYFLKSQKVILEDWNNVGWKSNLKKEMKNKLESVETFDWVTCPTHKELVIDLIQDLIITRIINLQCSNINKLKKANKTRHTRQILKSTKKSKVEEELGIEEITSKDWMLLTGMADVNAGVALHLQGESLIPSKQFLNEAINNATKATPEIIIDDPVVLPLDNVTCGGLQETISSEITYDNLSFENVVDVVVPQLSIKDVSSVPEPHAGFTFKPDSIDMALLETFETEIGEVTVQGSQASGSQTPTPSSSVASNIDLNIPTKEKSLNIADLEDAVRQGNASKLTIPQLKFILKHRKLKGYSRLNKEGLVKMCNSCIK